jgi:uncharacterized protein YggE
MARLVAVATTAAVATATKRAMQRAEGMAKGAGLTLGDLVSVGEVSDAPRITIPAPVVNTGVYASPPGGGTLNAGVTADTLDQFVDGELVRKVKVRVVYATK